MSNLPQTSKIIKLLWRAGKRGVPNYEFPKHGILRYSARINELRADGYDILCERQYLPNGRATNIFRYTLIEEDQTKKWWQR